jgi:hypothetical protein
MQGNIQQPLPKTPYGELLLTLLPPSNSPSRDRERSPVRWYKQILDGGKRVPTHVLVFKYSRITVPAGWVIHHIDGNQLNNHPCNLCALPIRFHTGLHHGTYELLQGIWYKRCGFCRKWLTLNTFTTEYRKYDECLTLTSRCTPCYKYTKAAYARKLYHAKKKMSTNKRAAS